LEEAAASHAAAFAIPTLVSLFASFASDLTDPLATDQRHLWNREPTLEEPANGFVTHIVEVEVSKP
jgi:hypothetical protein